MKKRLTGKPACIAILSVLIIISLADVILRATVLRETMFSAAYLGEPFIAMLISALLIFLALKDKDRLFYILCGALLGYFVLDHLFELPGAIGIAVIGFAQPDSLVTNNMSLVAQVLPILSGICIIIIAVLIVEYMNDGTIYNKAFNILCVATVLMLTICIIIGICDLISGAPIDILIFILNNLSRITMVFLFVFFAYDTAKAQLKKTNL